MKSQIFVAIGVAIVASVLVTGLASSINAQSNMTGGNTSMPAAGTTGDGGSDNGDGDDGNGDDDGDGEDGSDGEDESN